MNTRRTEPLGVVYAVITSIQRCFTAKICSLSFLLYNLFTDFIIHSKFSNIKNINILGKFKNCASIMCKMLLLFHPVDERKRKSGTL